MSAAAIDLADTQPEPRPATSAYATFIEELSANASYAALICIAATVVFVVSSVGSGWVLRISSAAGRALDAHLALVLMTVMKPDLQRAVPPGRAYATTARYHKSGPGRAGRHRYVLTAGVPESARIPALLRGPRCAVAA